MQFLTRAAGAAHSLKPAPRQEARAADASLRVDIETIGEMRETRLGPLKTTSMLMSALGALALIMASAGPYAILSYNLGQRTREIRIRLGHRTRLPRRCSSEPRVSKTLAKAGTLDVVTCLSMAALLAVSRCWPVISPPVGPGASTPSRRYAANER